MIKNKEVKGYLLQRKTGVFYGQLVWYEIPDEKDGIDQMSDPSVFKQRETISFSGLKNRPQARHLLDQAVLTKQHELDNDEMKESKHGIHDEVTKHLERMKESLRFKTYSRYTYAFKSMERALLHEGMKYIEDITTPKLEQAFEYLYRGDEKREGISLRTMRDYARVFHGLLKQLEYDNIITHDPMDHIRLPKGVQQNVEVPVKFMEKDEALRFLRYLRDTPKYQDLAPVFHFELYYGLRKEELVALRFGSETGVDLEHKLIFIDHVMTTNSIGSFEKNVKSKTSYRVLPIAKAVMPDLEEMLSHQNGIKYDKENNWVFTRNNGAHMLPTYLSKKFKEAILDCGFISPDIHFHSFRHTMVSIYFSEKKMSPEEISRFAGHSDSSVTMQIYAHTTRAFQQNIVDSIDGMFEEESNVG